MLKEMYCGKNAAVTEVEDFFENISLEWINSQKPQVKLSTYAKYYNVLKLYLNPTFGQKHISQITRSEVLEFSRMMLTIGGSKRNGLTPKTINGALSVLKNIFWFAEVEKSCAVADIKNISVRQPQKAMRILTRSEQIALSDYLCVNQTPCHLGILLCLYTGMRIGEICALKWGDIHIDEQYLYMGDVTADDIRLAIIPASKLSSSVFKSVNVLYKCIFHSALESKVIDKDPTIYLSPEGGGVPQKDRIPLTDEQVEKLLQATKGLPPYLFVMLGLYAGLRREEILALKWDSVYLDLDAPYLTVCRAWHTENNRPVILTELKTNAAKRSIPLPPRLLEALKEAKESSTSDYVIANKDGQPLTYTQFKRLWTYITTRTARPRKAKKLVGGKYVKYTIYPVLGEKARNNGKVVYCSMADGWFCRG